MQSLSIKKSIKIVAIHINKSKWKIGRKKKLIK